MKHACLSVRLDIELLDSFNAAVKSAGQPAAEILEELIRQYIEKIACAQKLKRKEAYDFARASMFLSGFKPSPCAELHAQRFIDGEIDLVEYLRPSFEEVHKADNL